MIASPSITYLRKLLPSYILSFFAAAISFSLLGGSESFLSLNYMAALLLFSISVSYLELSFHFRRFIQSILYTPLVVNFVVLTEYYEPRFLSVALVLISLPALFRLWGVLPQSILIVSSLFFLPTGANLVIFLCFAAQTLWIAREEDSHQSAKVPEVAQEHYSTFLSASFIAWSTLSLWLFVAAGEIPVNTVLSLLATVVCALSVKHFRPKEVFYFLVILSLLQVNALITEIPAGEGEVFLIMLVLSIGPLAFIYKSPITYSLLLASVFLIAQSLDALFLLTLLLLSVLNSLYYHYFVERHSSAWKRMKEVDSDSVFEVVSNQENNIFEGISRSIFLNNIQITCAVVVAVSLSALVLLVTPEGFSGLGRNFLLKSASVVMLAIAFANYFLVLRPVNSKNYVLFSLSLLVLTCFFISTYVPVLVLINLVLVLFVLLPLKESIVLLMFCAVSSYQALLALELVQLLPSMLLLYSVFFGINRVLYYYLNLTWTFEELISRVSKTSDQKSFRFNMARAFMILFDSEEALLAERPNSQFLITGARVEEAKRWSWPVWGLVGDEVPSFKRYFWLPEVEEPLVKFKAKHAVLLSMDETSVVLMKSNTCIPLLFGKVVFRKAEVLKEAMQNIGDRLNRVHLLGERLSQLETRLDGNESSLSAVVHDVNNTVQDLVIACEELMNQEGADTGRLKQILDHSYAVSTVLIDAKRSREIVIDSSSNLQEVVSLKECLIKTSGYAKLRAMRLDAEVIVEVCDSPAYCRVPSRDYLESALRNLLLNALQYGGRRVCVSVELKDLETKYEIRVKDNGPGISLENKDNIFKRGFRLKGDSSGLGIGLANARQVIEAAGGTLVLESPGSVDEDTCFLISLPRSCTEPISDKWVMVIEEGTQIANYYQSVLDSMGFAVRLADSFESADKVLSHEVPPQFVLADLQIAGESSLPLIRGSREKWGHSLPVLVVTGVRDSKTEVELSELGITQLVYKPVSRKALYSMIESLAQ